MGWPTTIKAGIEAAIVANTVLASADIFDRPERDEDPEPDTEQIFMRLLTIKPNTQASAQRFKIFPVEIVLVFKERPVRGDDVETDTVLSRKEAYDAALYAALETTNPWSTKVISTAIFQVDNVSRDLDYKLDTQSGARIKPAGISSRTDNDELQRIRQVWNFNVNET